MRHTVIEYSRQILDDVEGVVGNVVNGRTQLSQLIESLELLCGREQPLVLAGQVEVVEKPEDKVGDVVHEAGIGPRAEDGSATDVVQVQVGDVHYWGNLIE